MTHYKLITGLWEKITDGYKGTIDATETARCITGKESDLNYRFLATVKIISGKACLIINYVLSEEWEECYIEMILDIVNDKVTLDAVIRDEHGVETDRYGLASRDFPLNNDVNYQCEIQTKTLTDRSHAVYGFINDFLVVQVEDLLETWSKGLHGFECLGTEGQNTSFINIDFTTEGYSTKEEVKEVLRITDATHDTEITAAISDVDVKIDNALQHYEGTLPLVSVPNSINRASKYLAAAFYLTLNPVSDAMLKQAEIFDKIGNEFLSKYISEKYYVGKMV